MTNGRAGPVDVLGAGHPARCLDGGQRDLRWETGGHTELLTDPLETGVERPVGPLPDPHQRLDTPDRLTGGRP